MALAARTGRQLVEDALLELGILQAGETSEARDATFALDVMNAMMDSWAIRRGLIFEIRRNVHNLVGSQATYTIGTGGDFNQTHPIDIVRWTIIEDPAAADPNELPRDDPLTLEEWHRISVKTTESKLPYALYYDHAWAAGLGNVSLYPVPDSATPDIVLYTPEPLSAQMDLTTSYTFPPGYAEAIKYNLATRLARPFGKNVSFELKVAARSALTDLRAQNSRISEANFASIVTGRGGYGGRYDITGDRWR